VQPISTIIIEIKEGVNCFLWKYAIVGRNFS